MLAFCRSLVRYRCWALSCSRALGPGNSVASVRSSRAPLASLPVARMCRCRGSVRGCCSHLSCGRLMSLEPLLRLLLRDLLVFDDCWTFACCLESTLSFLFFSGLSRLLQTTLLSRLSAGSHADVEGSLEPRWVSKWVCREQYPKGG